MRECRPAAGHADLPLICWERIYPTLYQAPLLYTAERPDLHGHRCVDHRADDGAGTGTGSEHAVRRPYAAHTPQDACRHEPGARRGRDQARAGAGGDAAARSCAQEAAHRRRRVAEVKGSGSRRRAAQGLLPGRGARHGPAAHADPRHPAVGQLPRREQVLHDQHERLLARRGRRARLPTRQFAAQSEQLLLVYGSIFDSSFGYRASGLTNARKRRPPSPATCCTRSRQRSTTTPPWRG